MGCNLWTLIILVCSFLSLFFFPDKFVVIIMIDSNVPGGYSGIIVTGRYMQGPFCGFEIWDLS